MRSHRRPRGKIFFEAFCAVCVGVSFVGAWIQTGAWAFLAPAFVFTLFGLYWSFDMFGSDAPAAVAVEVEPVAAAPIAWAEPEPQPAEPADIKFERFELPAEPVAYVAPEPMIEPAPVAAAKPKRRANSAKAAEPVIAPMAAPEPIADEPAFDEGHEPHIEPLFDPKPFARQARPAFGKRPRGPGPRPLPA